MKLNIPSVVDLHAAGIHDSDSGIIKLSSMMINVIRPMSLTVISSFTAERVISDLVVTLQPTRVWRNQVSLTIELMSFHSYHIKQLHLPYVVCSCVAKSVFSDVL